MGVAQDLGWLFGLIEERTPTLRPARAGAEAREINRMKFKGTNGDLLVATRDSWQGYAPLDKRSEVVVSIGNAPGTARWSQNRHEARRMAYALLDAAEQADAQGQDHVAEKDEDPN